MASSSTQPLDPFGSALQAARDALVHVVEQPTWSITDDALPGLIRAADAAASAVAEIGCRLVAEAHTRGVADKQAATSTTAWMDQLTGCRAEAGQVTRTARRLVGRYNLVRVALATGEISLAKAHVIRAGLDRLPADLSADTLDRAQATMLEHAKVLDPKGLARVGLRLSEVIDPNAVDAHEQRLLEAQEAKAARSSWLTSRTDGGITRFWVRTPQLVGETLLSILDGYAAPRRTDEHGPDTRPYPRRLGEAFEELLSRIDPSDLPDHGGLPATLVITTPAASHQPTTGGTAGSQPNRGPGGGQPDRGGPDGGRDGGEGSASQGGGGQGGGGQSDGGPGGAGQRAGAAPGVGITAGGQPVSARAVSRLACTGWLMLLLLDDHGVPLTHGRTRRLFTLAQRVGFAVRDKGCVFPGCDRPPSWCEAHHIDPWSRGGGTDLTNGCLLCGYHHRLIHTGDWQIMMAADGHPYVIPPDWINPARTPIRNSYWHPDWQPKPQP